MAHTCDDNCRSYGCKHRHESEPRYTIKTTGNGFTTLITRLADGAELFLQGDDSANFLEQLEQTHDRWTDDDVCDEYSEQFAPRGWSHV